MVAMGVYDDSHRQVIIQKIDYVKYLEYANVVAASLKQ